MNVTRLVKVTILSAIIEVGKHETSLEKVTILTALLYFTVRQLKKVPVYNRSSLLLLQKCKCITKLDHQKVCIGEY